MKAPSGLWEIDDIDLIMLASLRSDRQADIDTLSRNELSVRQTGHRRRVFLLVEARKRMRKPRFRTGAAPRIVARPDVADACPTNDVVVGVSRFA